MKNIIEIVEDEVKQNRLDECGKCDRLFEPTYTCKECGCFMKIKTKFKHAKCPLGKWKV